MIPLQKPCPICKKEDSLQITKNQLFCSNTPCRFKIRYACPICNHELTESVFDLDEKGEFFKCTQCKNSIYTKRIKYLIENGFYIDHKTRCSLCHGPTIHHKEMNLAHRCFFFPGCSGQADLFGNIQKESLVFLDFETTGLEIGKDEIIEIGAIKIDEDGYDHTFQSFINPTKPITPHITKLTGITQEMVDDAPDLKTAITKLIEFIGEASIVAHNADFDIPFLVVASLRHQVPIQSETIICTLKWAAKLNEPSKSLSALTKKYRIFHHNAHRALADAAATRELFFIFENQKKEQRPIQTLDTYIENSQKIVNRYL